MTTSGLGIRCQAFQEPRRGHDAGECEDAYALAAGPHPGGWARFAVADGAGESAYSGLWARMLAEEFVRDDRPDWPGWIEPLQWRWAEAVRLPPEAEPLPWYLEDRYNEGAFATFLGVELTPAFSVEQGTASAGRWEAVAVGDTCLFQLREGRLLSVFPLTHSSQFGNTPWLVGSRTPTELPQRRAVQASGEWQPGDRMLLMTDALSRWFLSRAEEGEQPWTSLEEVLDQPEGRFAEWVSRLRASRQLRNDDTTLVAVTVQ